MNLNLKPVQWVGSSYRAFVSFPEAVQDEMGHALYLAQVGKMHSSAKPLKGFSGASVIELAEEDRHGTYRAIYTVQFESAVYVLHAFQKKSKKGIKTPLEVVALVRRRLKIAEDDHKARIGGSS